MRRILLLGLCAGLLSPLVSAAGQSGGTVSPKKQEALDLQACGTAAFKGFRPIAQTRSQRFNGKVALDTALCRGGPNAVKYRYAPWIDFTNYYGTGDLNSYPKGYLSTSAPVFRGV